MATYEERRLLSGLNGPYNMVEHLVEKRLKKIRITSVTQTEHDYIKEFVRYRQSKAIKNLNRKKSPLLSKKILTAFMQLIKIPVE